MSGGGRDAETKFWRMPELVEMLLPLLDPMSVLNLGKLHHPTLELIQRSIVWNKLLRNTIPDNKDAYWEDEGEESKWILEQDNTLVRNVSLCKQAFYKDDTGY